MGLFDLISSGFGGQEVLSETGDRLEARVTKSNRKVMKLFKDQGDTKYSVTEYRNGTRVETKTIRRK